MKERRRLVDYAIFLTLMGTVFFAVSYFSPELSRIVDKIGLFSYIVGGIIAFIALIKGEIKL
ncbi:MAG TPA: hypothetical protein ENG66_06370 [Thermococcus sp.]|nr:hypothetical protein [Thermococcus sp.]